jgi:serine/threonine-protein kinase
LIFTICAGVVAVVAGPLFLLRLLWAHGSAQPAPPVNYGIAWFLLVIWVVLAVILRSKRPLTLFQLRCIELIGFGVLALANAWWTYQLIRTGSLSRYASPDGVGTMLLASHTSLKWFSLMVIYGLFVPNTWRRCAAVVGAMALTPFVLSLAAGAADEALDDRVLTAFLLWMGFWALFGAAIAIYGSHKITLLRQEAFEARKLGQYQLKQRLGAGGMGEVYLAEHVLLRRP